jgi:hypothetical protein
VIQGVLNDHLNVNYLYESQISLIKHLEVIRIWKSLGKHLELSRMQFSNFIWYPFEIRSELYSNTLNPHSEIPNKVFRIIHSEIPSASWNFYTREVSHYTN